MGNFEIKVCSHYTSNAHLEMSENEYALKQWSQ